MFGSKSKKDADRDEGLPDGEPRRRPVRTLLVVLSVLLMGVGLAAPLVLGDGASSEGDSAEYGMSPRSGVGPAGLTGETGSGSEGDAAASEPEGAAETWSPALFRLGFSFFIGFAIAAAMRAFLKLTFIFAGLFALLMFGLQHAGIIEINWTLLDGGYDSAMSWLGGQFDSARTFIMGYVPSAASFLAGYAVGFRR